MSHPFNSISYGPHQAETIDQYPICADDIDFVMRIFARGETETLLRHRKTIRDLKDRSQHHRNTARAFDIEADLEKSLHLVECLLQGSRGPHSPCDQFLLLARAVSAETAPPERILEYAILLEEYALQLLTTSTSQLGSRSRGITSSPWSVLSGSEGRLPAGSAVTSSLPDRWTVRQMRRLLGAVSFHDPQGNVQRLNHSWPQKLQEGTNRYRSRKRRRQNPDGDSCGSYSSDNYTDTSDEEM